MKLISILYSLLTLPLFGLLEFILLPILKFIHNNLDTFCQEMVELNNRLALTSGRTKCKHPRSSFLAPGYRDYQEGCQLNTYTCLDCHTVFTRYDEI